MKVSGVGAGAQSSRTKRTDKTERKAGEFKDALTGSVDEAEDTRGVDGLSSLAGVNSLLAMQSMGDVTEREARRRMVRRGEDILDQLEDVRHGLLVGGLSKDKLETLAQTVRTQREDCADPGLGAVLDEIELRAEVELAKLSRDA